MGFLVAVLLVLLQQPRTTIDASKHRLLCAHVQRQIAGRTFLDFNCHVARRPSFHPRATLVGGVGDDLDEFCGDWFVLWERPREFVQPSSRGPVVHNIDGTSGGFFFRNVCLDQSIHFPGIDSRFTQSPSAHLKTQNENIATAPQPQRASTQPCQALREPNVLLLPMGDQCKSSSTGKFGDVEN